MSSGKRAKKSGRNTGKTTHTAEAPQFYDLTQGMPKADPAGDSSNVDVFRPVQETASPLPDALSQAPQDVTPPPPGTQYRPRPLITAPQAVPLQAVPRPFPVPQIPQPGAAPRIQVAPQPVPVPQIPQPEAAPQEAVFTQPEEPALPHNRAQEAQSPHPQKKRKPRPAAHGSRKKKEKSDLDKVYDYVNGKKTLDLPDGVQGATEALPQHKPKKTYVPVKEGTGKTRPATLKAERLRRRKQEERLTYMIVACVILFLIASGFLLRILWNYRRTAAEYADITDTYVVQGAIASADEAAAEAAPYPPLDIDFPGLFALNSDLVAWIHMPGCNISYPVVQTSDNDYYLNHTFLKSISSGGAVFLDTGDHNDFSDFNSFLYGHNMQDGSMFGSLHRLWQDEELADREPFFYLYLKSGTVRKYRVVSYYRDHGDSDSYLRMTDSAEKQAYAEMILEKSAVNPEKSPETAAETLTGDDLLVTLSTCHGGVNSGQRFLVHGKLIGVY